MITFKIKKILEKQKMTVQELSAKTDISRSSLDSMFERDDFKVSTLEKIAEALNTPLSTFFDDRTEEEQGNYAVSQTGKGYNISQVQGGVGNKQNMGNEPKTKPAWPTDLSECMKELWEKDKKINLLQDEILQLYREKARGWK
jgi:transcriptional regulator with XRE-family HTH domain